MTEVGMDETRDDSDHPATSPADAEAWQIARINEGLDAAREGRVQPAEEVFAAIAAKHGWIADAG